MMRTAIGSHAVYRREKKAVLLIPFTRGRFIAELTLLTATSMKSITHLFRTFSAKYCIGQQLESVCVVQSREWQQPLSVDYSMSVLFHYMDNFLFITPKQYGLGII